MKHGAETEMAAPVRWSRMGRWLTAFCVGVPFVLWAIGQGWRDVTWLTGLCFYIPSPLLAVWTLAVGAWLFSIRHPRAGVAALLLSVVPTAVVVMVENQWVRPAPPPVSAASGEPLRVVHWNVQRAARGWDRVVDRLLSLDADAYFLSEHTPEMVLDRFEGYDTIHFLGMAAVVRGELSGLKKLRSEGPHYTFMVNWQSEQGAVRLIMADIGAFLTIHREVELKILNDQIRQWEPDLVLGDLNAPRRSNQLSPPVAGYLHAYDAAGAGWSYTWPVPTPMYAIDQMLFGERIAPVRYDLITSRRSDHRMQRFEFHVLTDEPASVASP